MQVCLPKHNYKLDDNILTVEPRALDPHCFDADPEPDPDPAQNLDADPDPDPDVHPPWQNPRYAPGCSITENETAIKIRVRARLQRAEI